MQVKVRALTMYFYKKGGKPFVELSVEYESGEPEVLCDTELDAPVIRVVLEKHDPKEDN